MPPDDPTGWAAALVVIPTYNEADNIEAILTAVTTAVPEASVLVVDDGSPDGTGELVEKAIEADPRIHLLRGEGKRGLGQAYIAGFHWGLDHGYGLFVEMDADFSHDPAAIPDLLGAAAEADVVVGSRYIPGGGVEGWSQRRHALSRAGNVYARLVLGFAVKDATGGFRCYRREVLEAVDLPGVRSNGYAFQIDMTYRAWRLGFRIAEVPITFRERELGTSKMSGSIVREALVAVARWGLQDRLPGRRTPGAS
ncbi:MAG TPA: polyprenol monophosphomannose synthase [Actinomycetota bacterium]|nr:polyprenol monophosphomannose synthase [Actinomycetota bacterium]